ncbi:crossover junction endodeoxyribonuclease RuvC [Pseudothauera nasutitermitis]|uniref:Crossover junction endodeoxyribonuclease RuvC n=1 Tax=Pseudothauera nasutitermitis TaxID=2565930 RepID=A0A4S4AWT2_9RHOO|nr:crossover junction endodeoxyribonuclease RuvC [Pseudothauera nasutitermitis]THF63068.1 crossover junction endodeoxyribonuclease RuvC [Pseudothauera nasutitermitis]
MKTAASSVTTRILGLDPGLRITGFGLVDQLGNQLRYVASGTIRTQDGELPGRLRTLLDGVREVIQTYSPDQVAVEKVFVNVNPQSTLLLGQARGAVICGAVSCDLPVAEYTALQVKQSVVGYGKANKEQVQHMVQRLLSLPALPGPDAADALACAICHAHGSAGLGALAGTTRRRAGRLLAPRSGG